MDNIHILHIGGFEIDAANADPKKRNVDTRKDQVDAIVATLGQRQVDYIVVCGDLTAAGDFTGVKECLGRLERVLSGYGSRKRILIAPGRKDESANNGESFRAFHESFYAKETMNGQKIEAPTEAAVDARLFRDITLIAGLHAGVTPPAEELSALCGYIRAHTERWSEAHTFEGLRILAVDSNPLLSAPQLYFSARLGTLSREIDLILCGPGNVPIVPVQPFAKMPPIVGLPPRSANGSSEDPLFWNMVCVRVPPQPRDSEATRFEFIVKSYDERLVYDRPALRYSPDNHVSRDQHSESVLLCKRTLLQNLEKELMRAGLIEVTMYGEVWKTIIMEGLHSGMQIGDRRLVFKSFFLKSYPPGDKPTEWRADQLPILQEIQAWQARLPAGEAEPVALVVDVAFSAQEAINKNRVDEVKKHLKETFESVEDGLQIVYLVSSYDTSRKVDKYSPRIHLDPIDQQTLRQFIALASCALPIQPRVFEDLTGGYVGFIKLLTDELRADYLGTERHEYSNKWNFEEAVERCCGLSEKLRIETALFFRSLTNQSEKRQRIAERFLEKMAMLRDMGRGHLLRDEVSISSQEANDLGLFWELEELSLSHIVAHKDDRFVLKERIPFLVQMERPVGVQVVFLSFDERDRKLINRLKTALTKAGLDNWEWKDASNGREWLESAIKKELNRCAMVVVLWTENSVESELVIGEARIAALPDSPRLLNWFEGVVPPSHKAKLEKMKARGEALPTENKAGRKVRKVSEALDEFSGKGLGADSLEEVIMKLKTTLHPLPRFPKKRGGGA